MAEKVSIAYPLYTSGDGPAYQQSLLNILEFVSTVEPTQAAFRNRLKTQFGGKEGYITRQIQFLRRLNAIVLDENTDSIHLGPLGRRYLADKAPDTLYIALEKNVTQLSKLVELLDKSPHSIDELVEATDSSRDRVRQKLRWLETAEAVTRENSGYELTQTGRDLKSLYSAVEA